MSSITLVLEASTPTASVAVLDGDNVLAEHTTVMRAAAGERMLPAIEQCLREAGISLSNVERIVCGAGPGGFTSLRISGSLAKGFAVGCSLPLFAVPSHLLTIASVEGLGPGRYLVVNDAMRGEWFVTEVEIADGERPALRAGAGVASGDLILDRVRSTSARIVGPGAKTLGPDAVHAEPRASAFGRLKGYLETQTPVDLALWEPAYGRLAEAQVKWEAAHGRALR
jgi:tRNA threonylcarbamoyladenosine biosynthesis protein TsaB